MAWPKGPRVIVDCRIDDPHAMHNPGSVESTCGDCGATVLMSLESQREQALKGTPNVCIPCYVRHAAEGHPVSLICQRRVF